MGRTMLSSGSSQKVLSSALVGTMIISSILLLHFYYFKLSASSLVFTSGWQHDADVLQYVNPKIGTYGITPNGNGGMIPSVSPPFGMTRWTPQTRENFISQCPYNDLDTHIHGFQATHQPAILTMGAVTVEAGHNLTESMYSPVPGGAQPVPVDVREGANGRVRRSASEETFGPEDQWKSPQHEKRAGDTIKAAITATSHVGFIRFEFSPANVESEKPYIFVQATRQNWTGSIHVDPTRNEIAGSNPQRQDYALGPLAAKNFSGYFVSRFSGSFEDYGVVHGDQIKPGQANGEGEHLGAYVKFAKDIKSVEVRTGVSFVSVEQARRNLDLEAPSSVSFNQAATGLKAKWLEQLDRFQIRGVNHSDNDHDQRTIFYTSLFHALQYPSDFAEPLQKPNGGRRTYYSGYIDSVHFEEDSYYQSWSIWDTFRAEHSFLTMFAPERVNSMMRSLVKIYRWAGRLPMWANIVETNIMIGTHVDAVIANALTRGFRDFDISSAWSGVGKNAFEPPIKDTELLYYDREVSTPDEACAGSTTYMSKGYVANDKWAESGSRTLDYAFDDHAAAVVARYGGDDKNARHLGKRSKNYRNIYNAETGFMEAKNDNGTWAGREQGWTEGDEWIYTFNVMHDVTGLAELMGGREKMKAKLDEYFSTGRNDHSNEPSHHAPYLYAAIGFPSVTQTLVREIAQQNYNATSAGLSGNEDLGQMWAWYIYTALGFYPVNPASDEYIVGAPFFEEISIGFPAGAATGGNGGEEGTLTITAPGAPTKPYVKSLRVDGESVDRPLLSHQQIVTAKSIAFEMSATPQTWGHEL